MNGSPEDWERLIGRLAEAGGNAMYHCLEDAVALLEKYPKKPVVRSRLLSAEEYDTLLQRQKGVCAICGRKPEERLVVDHDHSSGKVRGLLCSPCNLGLGIFEDDPGRLVAGAEYLGKMSAYHDGV